MSTVKVGDELAIGNRWYEYQIHHVKKISPKGFITMSNHDVLNSDLTIRGHRKLGTTLRPDRFERVTPSVIEQMDRVRILDSIKGRRNWDALTTDQLRRIVAILDEGAANGT